MRTSSLRIDLEPAEWGVLVDLIVDGRSLDREGHYEQGTAKDLLDSGALVPADPPRRIALYGCGCGEFGCANLSPLVRRDGDLVRWSDFVSVTGHYISALPRGCRDPARETNEFVHRLDVADLAFAGDEYDAVVAEAAARAGECGRAGL